MFSLPLIEEQKGAGAPYPSRKSGYLLPEAFAYNITPASKAAVVGSSAPGAIGGVGSLSAGMVDDASVAGEFRVPDDDQLVGFRISRASGSGRYSDNDRAESFPGGCDQSCGGAENDMKIADRPCIVIEQMHFFC